MSLYVGQKVIYVGGRKTDRAPHPCDPPHLVLGQVYTVRDVDRRAMGDPRHDEPTIRLEETKAPVFETTIGPWEIGYWLSTFRPLTERKTDISIFTEMLTPKQLERVGH